MQDMTVADLMKLKSLKYSCIIAGHQGSEREVTGVNVMEVPDILNWVKPGEFLMTAGYSYKDDPEGLAALLPQLASAGVAALGIKKNRYFKKIPEIIVDAANCCQMPLLELDETLVFSNAVRDVLNEITGTEYKLLSTTLQRFNSLSQTLIEGRGLPEFVHRLYVFVNNPVILWKQNMEYIAEGISKEQRSALSQNPVWEYDGLRQEKQGWKSLLLAGEEYRAFFLSIIHDEEKIGELLILEKDRPLTNEDTMLVYQSAFMVSMELMSVNIRTKVEAKYADEVIQNWILGKTESTAALHMRSEICGMKIDTSQNYCIAVPFIMSEYPYEQLNLQFIRLQKSVRNIKDMYISKINETIVCVIPEKMREQCLQSLLEETQRLFGKEGIQLCVGRTSSKSYDLLGSYEDAMRIAKVNIKAHLENKVLYYHDLSIYIILYLIPMGDEVEEYLSRYLHPVLEYDKKHGTNMYETLKVYLQNKGNAKATAEYLFAHYNTVNYRLERIREIMKMELNDSENQFGIQLAIRLYEMYL